MMLSFSSLMSPFLNSIKRLKKSFRFFSPTKHMPTESFLLAVTKSFLKAIFLTSNFVKFYKGKRHLENSFSDTSCKKYV